MAAKSRNLESKSAVAGECRLEEKGAYLPGNEQSMPLARENREILPIIEDLTMPGNPQDKRSL